MANKTPLVPAAFVPPAAPTVPAANPVAVAPSAADAAARQAAAVTDHTAPIAPAGMAVADAPSAADTAALKAAALADQTAPLTAPVYTPSITFGGRSVDDAAMDASLTRAAARLSPPAAGPVPPPLPAVQAFGTKGAALADRPVTVSAFDRRTTIGQLLSHPSADVRQRAAEAEVAIHHGAADMGLKVKAAIDTARGVESRR